MTFPQIASAAVHFAHRIPTVFWAAWILAVVIGSAMLALNAPAIG